MKPLLTSAIVILVILIAALGIFVFVKFKKSIKHKTDPSSTVQSLAVLPFKNLDKDSSQSYFSEGLTEDILNSLSQLKDLKISASYSSFKFANNENDIQNVGKKLGVLNVLAGNYQLQGDKINLTAELINTKNGSQIWSGKYVETLDNIFSLQTKIINDVEEKLNIVLDDDEQNIKKPTNDINAYKLYLKGRASWNLRTSKDLMNGIDFFKRAIALDSSYAAAYAGIADCYTALGYGNFLTPKESFPKAFEAATKALKIDPTLAEPHASLGYYDFYYRWDWAAAEQEFRAAISSNPNYALAYDWYGYYLTAMKRYDEAKIMFSKAAELDPFAAPIVTDMGFGFYYKGDYDAAIKKLQQSLGMDPKLGITFLWMGRSYQAEKKYPEAISAYEKAIKFIPGWPVAFAQIGNVYGVAGNKADAKNILDTLMSFYPKQYVTAYGIALIYAGLNENDFAFEWLNKAYDERTNWMVWLRSDPRWISIKSDKRFKELVNKVGLPE